MFRSMEFPRSTRKSSNCVRSFSILRAASFVQQQFEPLALLKANYDTCVNSVLRLPDAFGRVVKPQTSFDYRYDPVTIYHHNFLDQLTICSV